MTFPVDEPLARVTVEARGRRIDVALPDAMPLIELLPELLENAGVGVGVGEPAELHGGWVLRRPGGQALDPGRTLRSQGVADGEILRLVPGRTEWPELDYEDVVEAIAAGARRYGRSWTAAATRWCGLVAGGAALAVGLLVEASPDASTTSGTILLGAAALLIVAGTALARALRDAVAGAMVAACGMPYGFVGALLMIAPHARIGGPRLVFAASVLLVCAVAGYVGVGVRSRVFVAGATAGAIGLLAGLLGLTPVSTTGVAALAVTVALNLIPAYPLLAARLGNLPVPELPQRAADMTRDTPQPDRKEVFAAVARADEALTGLLTGTSVIAAACAPTLLAGGHGPGTLLALLAAVSLILRARLFPCLRQRVPLLLAGGGISAGALVLAELGAGPTTRAVSLVAILALAGLLTAAGLVYSRRSASPYLGRVGDILDIAAICALLPVTGVVVGLFAYVQHVLSSLT